MERQYTKLDKGDLSRDEFSEWVVDLVTRSLIQQRERLYDLSDMLIGTIVDEHCPPNSHIDDWDFDALDEALGAQFNTSIKVARKNVDQEVIAQSAWEQVEKRLDERMKELGRPWLMYFARHFYLEETDHQWIEHLKNMDHLREGIGLRGYGQKDPKKEYKREGFDLFSEMMRNIQHNTGQNIYRVQIRQEEEVIPSLQKNAERETHENLDEDGDESESSKGNGKAAAKTAQPQRRERPKIGRNDPCHCGSGKKYKKCHGREGSEASI